MPMATFISHNPAETESLGEEWGRQAQNGWLIGLSGGLGAGKTQLVSGLARGLGAAERAPSPTFALVHEYRGGRLPLFHVDLYRLATREQIIAAGLESYLVRPRGVAVVEWIERWLGARAFHWPGNTAACKSKPSARRSGKFFMKILAVEFSSECRSAALLQGGELLGHAAETGGRRVIGLVEQALQQAGCEREEVETIAVGLGPGSYAGIRGAIAFAQGWQLGLGVNLVGVSSVECLAARAEMEKIFGPVNIVVDAQRNEFYLARFEIRAGRAPTGRAAAFGGAFRNRKEGRRGREDRWAGHHSVVSAGHQPVS